VVGQVRDADLVERGQDLAAAVPAGQPTLPVDQRHRHVLGRRQVLEQEEPLEHESRSRRFSAPPPAVPTGG
jgi:hypothetical protein